ncbi:MAG: hypothetical protein RLZZ227_2443 [Pseudomonadota bacterium]|jgi:hypothetical protein
MKNLVRTLSVLLSLCTSAIAQDAVDYDGAQRWWRGNTHAHTWWSDGDTPPELIAQWYKEQGYQFLVLSDHNTFQQGEKWYPIDEPPRPLAQVQAAYAEYLRQFGSNWVDVRGNEGSREVRLKTLEEFRTLFEEPEKFIFIKGEEITDGFQNHPIHMNGMNLVEHVEPLHGDGVAATIQNNLNLVVAQSEKYQQPMLVHLNHPNFHFAQTAEDLFALDHKPGDGFFEMYNGHSGVQNYGDARHESTERIWDIVLSKRLGEFGRSVIYGVATDDAHVYQLWGLGNVNPGRGWMMVRSNWLTPNKITEAIKRGDFYNSTGVTLESLDISDERMQIEIKPERGVRYRIEFIGTLQDADLEGRPVTGETHEHEGSLDHLHQTIYRYSDDIGRVLKTVEGTSATYHVQGNEIYVRARITSSRAHPNPYAAGDTEMAWTQPLVVLANDADR